MCGSCVDDGATNNCNNNITIYPANGALIAGASNATVFNGVSTNGRRGTSNSRRGTGNCSPTAGDNGRNGPRLSDNNDRGGRSRSTCGSRGFHRGNRTSFFLTTGSNRGRPLTTVVNGVLNNKSTGCSKDGRLGRTVGVPTSNNIRVCQDVKLASSIRINSTRTGGTRTTTAAFVANGCS